MDYILYHIWYAGLYGSYSVIYRSKNMELVFEGKTFILPPIYLEAPTEQKFILMACNVNLM